MEDLKRSEEKRCVACKGKLIRISKNVYLQFDNPFRLIQDGLSMDVYECEECHRLDFYNCSPETSVVEQCDNIVICPQCGNNHSEFINCPQCAAERGFISGYRSQGKEKSERKERNKKKNVPWEP